MHAQITFENSRGQRVVLLCTVIIYYVDSIECSNRHLDKHVSMLVSAIHFCCNILGHKFEH